MKKIKLYTSYILAGITTFITIGLAGNDNFFNIPVYTTLAATLLLCGLGIKSSYTKVYRIAYNGKTVLDCEGIQEYISGQSGHIEKGVYVTRDFLHLIEKENHVTDVRELGIDVYVREIPKMNLFVINQYMVADKKIMKIRGRS